MSEEALLPPNSTIWERSVSGALGFELDADAVTRIKDPATCPVALLPYLAAEEGVDNWSAAWPEVIKRSAITTSWATHRFKGTPAVMDSTVSQLGTGWSWAEWFEYGGRPYRFRLNYQIGVAGLSFNGFLAARDAVNRVKNVRSIMEFASETEGEAAVRVGVFSILSVALGDLASAPPFVAVAVGVFGVNQTSIGDVG